MSSAGFSRLLSTGRGIREPSSTEEKRIWVKGRVVAVLHLRLSAAEWDVWIPRCRGSVVRRAVPPPLQWGGTTRTQSTGLDGRDCGGGPGAGVGQRKLLRSEIGSEMEVCLSCDSQLLPGPRLFPPWGAFP